MPRRRKASNAAQQRERRKCESSSLQESHNYYTESTNSLKITDAPKVLCGSLHQGSTRFQ